MKAIMVMFDSLNRHMLAPYGCDWVHTPQFSRLAERTATFTNSYVGSMPCMPARRELHTGRYNFLHRSWGPLEPFDDSMPEILKQRGIWTHLASDHYHYWEEGGCTYHTRYQTWDTVRGQEGDPWKADLTVPVPDSLNNKWRQGAWIRQDWVNRAHMQNEPDMSQPRTFALGLDFLRTNARQDNWFLHLETFDPHEPYYVARRFLDMYQDEYAGPHWDWPPYDRVQEDPVAVRHMRIVNAALHSMCDWYLGQILNAMDELDLWKDTMLIVNTDHGFLLSEHDWWGKCVMPFYNEIARTPLFIWDPRCGARGVRRNSLVQTIDLPATLLEYFGAPLPPDMQGVPLRNTVATDAPVREAGLFGLFGHHVNCTDGRYVYMRAPVSDPQPALFEYTLMPTHMRHTFEVKELQKLEELAAPFPFTKGCRTMKVPAHTWATREPHRTLLFDLERDSGQKTPIRDPAAEERMANHMVRLMQANHAPAEQYARFGFPAPRP